MSRHGDKFQRMRIFVTLVKAGSFAKAAERLQIKSPTVSKAIQLLEKELQTQLVVRSTRTMSLTDTGQRYYDKAEFILNELDELENETKQAQGTPKGKLMVTTPVSLGLHLLAPLMPKFMKLYPELEVELDLSNHWRDLKRDGYDVAIRSKKPGADLGLYCLPIKPLLPILVASPEYLEANGTPTYPQELKAHSVILHKGGDRLFNQWKFSNPEKGEFAFEVQSRYISNHIPVSIEGALQGLGILNTYSVYVEEALKDGALIQLLADFEQPDIDRFAFYHQKRALSPKLDAFLSFLEEEIGMEK
ncbi:hypothetical protein OA91_10575 [Marinomonas sp. SBI8L]|nr:hypothetical protein OA91_10575 [Marinomonas sp. SBI8L]